MLMVTSLKLLQPLGLLGGDPLIHTHVEVLRESVSPPGILRAILRSVDILLS